MQELRKIRVNKKIGKHMKCWARHIYRWEKYEKELKHYEKIKERKKDRPNLELFVQI
jgi:hypothetical protein